MGLGHNCKPDGWLCRLRDGRSCWNPDGLENWLRQGKCRSGDVVSTGLGPAHLLQDGRQRHRRDVGSVSGGCVDRPSSRSPQVLASGRPRRLEYSVQDERAWDVGLTCGGQVQVFVEPLPRDSDAIDVVPTGLASIGMRLAQGQPIVRTVVIRGRWRRSARLPSSRRRN
jgi:hypothetical protein